MDAVVLTVSNLFSDKNDKIRIDILRDVSAETEAGLLTFLRRIGAVHLYAERILPIARTNDSLLFAAVIDRAWPPWGLGARTIHGICQVQQIGDRSFSIGPLLVADEDLTNIGLQAAIFKEVLDFLGSNGDGELGYLLIEGSVLADRIMAASGFQKTDEFVLNEHGHYNAYRAPASKVLASLGLEDASSADLLAFQIEDQAFERNAAFHTMLQLAMRPALSTSFVRAELLAMEGLLSGAALPGGVSTSKVEIEREEVEREREEVEREREGVEREREEVEREREKNA
jgi:hypothetical protein